MMIGTKFNPFPEIITERLTLNNLTVDDAHAYFEMCSDTYTMRYIPRPIAKTINDVLTLIEKTNDLLEEGNDITWGIKLKNEGKLIGTIGYYRIQKENYRGEIGYTLNKHYEGKGLMREATKKIIDFGFNTIGFHSIEAVIDPANERSENLLKHFGFIKEAHIRENCFYEGQFLDSVIYSLLKRKYANG